MTTTPTLRDAAQAAKEALSVAESLLAQDKSYHHAQVLKAYNDLAAALAAPADALAEPVAYRTRFRAEPGMIGHYPWTYCEPHRVKYRNEANEYEALYTAPPATQLQQAAVAREREECAAICDALAVKTLAAQNGDPDALCNVMLRQIAVAGHDTGAAAIRAKGQQ